MAGHIESTDILMVGKTGTGKSALGNAILQKKAFKSQNSVESVTKTADFDYCEFDGRRLKVVDGPGLGDTELEPREAVKLVVDAMSNAICANPEGYHAILLAVRYGNRFTREDKETVVTLKKIFGEKFITDHAILVLTCGDSFKNDAEESGQTFEEWCAEQRGVFGQLYTDVQKRAILFDNTTKERDIKYDQVRRLLDMVDALGTRYTCKMFEEAKHTRYRLLHSARRLVNEEALRESGVIAQLLGRVDYSKPAEGLRQLQDLRKRASVLLEDVSKQDQGTNTLKVAMKIAQNLEATTAVQLEEMQRIFDEMLQEESERSGIPEPKCEQSLTDDEFPVVMMRQKQHAELGEHGTREAERLKKVKEHRRRGVDLSLELKCEETLTEAKRQSDRTRHEKLEDVKATEEKPQILRLEKEETKILEMKKFNELERPRAENKKGREEEERAEETAKENDLMDLRKRQQELEKLTQDNKETIDDFKRTMWKFAAEREEYVQEKLARLEEDYQKLKEESRSAWLKASPSVFTKIWSGFGFGGGSGKK